MNETYFIAIVGFLGWILSLYIMRWVFDIERIVRETSAQRKLLEIIAMKSGAEAEQVLEARGKLRD